MKIGDIVVLTGGNYTSHKLNELIKIVSFLNDRPQSQEILNDNNRVYLNKFNLRLATQPEINAYNRGIRNISQIKKVKPINYIYY
jgi:hypothetical protein